MVWRRITFALLFPPLVTAGFVSLRYLGHVNSPTLEACLFALALLIGTAAVTSLERKLWLRLVLAASYAVLATVISFVVGLQVACDAFHDCL